MSDLCQTSPLAHMKTALEPPAADSGYRTDPSQASGYSAEAVANSFLRLARRSDRQLTNMQLQKLVYIAHGFSLAILGRPLISDPVEAWRWGPVFPGLYGKLRKYGADTVTDEVDARDSVPLGSEAHDLIRAVFDQYGDVPGPKLSGMTHQKGSPWSRTWEEDPQGYIPQDLIRAHYKDLLHG